MEAQTSQPDENQAPLRGRRILVVDDEPDARTFIGTVLEDAGAEIIEAADGDEALAMAAKAKPDLITLDVSMPGRDGVEIFGELRRAEATAAIPVCVVTGHPEFREVICQRASPPPEGYLDKPVREDQLLATVGRILTVER